MTTSPSTVRKVNKTPLAKKAFRTPNLTRLDSAAAIARVESAARAGNKEGQRMLQQIRQSRVLN